MSVEKFDAIVVGAGPAGSTAAFLMAKAGLNVVLIERGEYPGAKNLFGGVINRWPLDNIIPQFYEKAPIERKVIENRLMVLSKESGLSLGFKDLSFNQPPYNTFTVLRAKFDRWFAGLAEKEGAILATSVAIDDIIKEGNKIVGVRAGEGSENELYGDIVIAADGVHSKLGIKAGLRGSLTTHDAALGVKEVLELPVESIESRFNLGPDEGAALIALGVTKGMSGGGLIYTNRNSLSVGVVILVEHLIKLKMKPYELLDEFKTHPLIAPLIEDGESKEYCAHLIPEAGHYRIPKMYTDGFLIAGDAAFLCSGLYQEGTDMAIESGMFAAQTAIRAKKMRDFSARTLSIYEDLIKSGYGYQELYLQRHVPKLFATNQRLFQVYPQVVNSLVREFLTTSGESKRVKRKKIMGILKERIGYLKMLSDLISGRKIIP